MKLMSKTLSAAVAMVAALGFASAARAVPTITLSVQYVGSAMASNGDPVNNFDGKTADSIFTGGVTMMDPNSSITQTTAGLANMYEVFMKYTPSSSGPPASDYFEGVIWSVHMGPGIQAIDLGGGQWIAAADLNGAGTPKAMLDNNQSTDGSVVGITTGALSIAWASVKSNAFGTSLQPTKNTSYDSTLGTPIGFFAMAFTGQAFTTTSITVSPDAASGSLAYYAGNGSSAPGDAFDAIGVSGTVNITGAAPTTPEPASLGVLALGGLALLARRRK